MRTPLLLSLLVVAGSGCADLTPVEVAPGGPQPGPQLSPGLDDLQTVTYGGESLTLWPFTGTGPSRFLPADPVNLLFVGANEPRAIRAALLAHDGVRSGGLAPFDCVWTDAIGDPQTAYTEPGGWSASTIQLQCGEYGPIRFHIRLFDAGDWTLGGVHLEVLVTGTTDHRILNWELPELLIASDLSDAGVLGAAPAVTAPIFPSPYRVLDRPVYDALPAGLQQLILGWPGVVPATGDVPLLTDERATVLSLATTLAGERIVARQRFTIDFAQLVPRPFCAPVPIYVEGPVQFHQTVVSTPSGNFISEFHALGHLDVTPIDPATGSPGATHRALVNQHAKGIVTDKTTLTSLFIFFTELPKFGTGNGMLMTRLNVGPKGAVGYTVELVCS